MEERRDDGRTPQPRLLSLWPARSDQTDPASWPSGSLLSLACDVLEMDLALLTEIHSGREEVREAVGTWPDTSMEELAGYSLPLQDTLCERLLREAGPAYVQNAAVDPSARDLAATQLLGIGAWIGALVPAEGARQYVLCCLAREQRPGLGAVDAQVIAGLAASLARQIQSGDHAEP